MVSPFVLVYTKSDSSNFVVIVTILNLVLIGYVGSLISKGLFSTLCPQTSVVTDLNEFLEERSRSNLK
jgi:hypothetical protein